MDCGPAAAAVHSPLAARLWALGRDLPECMSEPIMFESPRPPEEVLRRLRAEAADWHESRSSAEARAELTCGLRLRVRGSAGGVAIRLSARGDRRTSLLPVFEGVLEGTATGSTLVGRFRGSRLGVVVFAAWFALVLFLVVGAPLYACRRSGSVAQAISAGVLAIVVAGVFGLVGWWIVSESYRAGEVRRGEMRAVLTRVML